MQYNINGILIDRQEIPFALLTQQQATFAIQAEKEAAMVRMFHKRGDYKNATYCTNRYYQYANLLQQNSTGPAALKSSNRNVVTAVDTGFAFNFNTPLPFDATEAQLQECRSVLEAQFQQEFGIAFNRVSPRDERKVRYFRLINECIAKIPYQNILNEHVKRNGAVAMYSLFDRDQNRLNNRAGGKQDAGDRWIANVEQITGLSFNNITQLIDTGVIDQFGVSALEVQDSYQPFFQNINFGGIVANPQNTSTDINIFDTNTGTQTPKLVLGDDVVETIILTAGNIVAAVVSTSLGPYVLLATALLTLLWNKFKDGNDKVRQRESLFIELAPGVIVPQCSDLNGVDDNCVVPGTNNEICIVDGQQVPCSELIQAQGGGNKGGVGLAIAIAAALGVFLFSRS